MKNLEEKLALHKLWLDREEGGVLLDLSGEYLSDANLSSTNLSDAKVINNPGRLVI